MIDLVRVIAFLIRSAKELRFSRGLVALVVLTSILSGAASTAFLPVINKVLNHSGPLQELMWTFVLLCVALPVLRFSSGVLLLRMTQKVLLDLRLQSALCVLREEESFDRYRHARVIVWI